MKKPYLAIFTLPTPMPEHLKIIEVIRDASDGDFKQFIIPAGVGFVFMSEMKPWKISFERILMNTDSKLITEIGESYTQQGFGAVDGWLNSHFPKR